MGHRLGIHQNYDQLFEEGEGGEKVRQSGIYPKQPLLSEEEWEAINTFYLALSDSASATKPNPLRPISQANFKIRKTGLRIFPPMTAMVSIDTRKGGLFVGDVKSDGSSLTRLDFRLQEAEKVFLPAIPVQIQQRGNVFFVTSIGNLLPSDNPEGSLLQLINHETGKGFKGFIRVLPKLQRPVQAGFADFNKDGEEGLVVAEFGNLTGGLRYYYRTKKGEWSRQAIKDQPGALAAQVADFNQDGFEDVLALFGQGDECISLFENQGGKGFKEKCLLRFPPTYGSTSMQATDFNQDGYWDILYTCGDNADFMPLPRPYHGIRIFLNDGANNFEEAFFFAQNGAYKAQAFDFDEDGDLDIASIAFFPDFANRPREGFVFLENKGSFQFTSYGLDPEFGRWMVMDCGDVDLDGDLDIALGSFIPFELLDDKNGLYAHWMNKGESILIIENLLNPKKDES
ncbi:MAG: VCBS repeat-containing protein [Phaeodactylibacter sp.]|nr:VCBS repeat-containing protein [Phaeodactylibacter sp.]MCB9290500.1 VCBS repeat-containing protein [Lewinellaceae bacterium]